MWHPALHRRIAAASPFEDDDEDEGYCRLNELPGLGATPGAAQALDKGLGAR